MAALIPDEKCLISLIKILFWLVQYATGYHPGPVVPPTADGASFIAPSFSPPQFNSDAKERKKEEPN